MTIESRMPREEYDAIDSLNISRLKVIKRSPQHFLHALAHPKSSAPMTLGTAAHVATLEPERFERDFAIWSRMSEAGNLCPRKGQYWDAFRMENPGRTVLTPDEAALAKAIAVAVRSDANAFRYLERGDPEVTIEWSVDGRLRKGRIDWLTRLDGVPYVVGLKTARDCRHFAFGHQAAKLLYHLQWAWYHDGYEVSTGKRPQLVEIVVESEPPHAVATYRISEDIIAQGRDEYQALLQILSTCEQTGEWPGPAPLEDYLTLPSWVYPEAESDLSDLGLETTA